MVMYLKVFRLHQQQATTRAQSRIRTQDLKVISPNRHHCATGVGDVSVYAEDYILKMLSKNPKQVCSVLHFPDDLTEFALMIYALNNWAM
jgi:hypothetical protein